MCTSIHVNMCACVCVHEYTCVTVVFVGLCSYRCLSVNLCVCVCVYVCVCVCRGPVWEETCSPGPTQARCRPSGAEDEVQRPGSTLALENLQVFQGLGVWFNQPGLGLC